MIKRALSKILRWLADKDVESAGDIQAREVAFAVRDMAHQQLGIWIDDEQIDLRVRFVSAVQAGRTTECFDEWLIHQLFAYLTPERKRQIVAELASLNTTESK